MRDAGMQGHPLARAKGRGCLRGLRGLCLLPCRQAEVRVAVASAAGTGRFGVSCDQEPRGARCIALKPPGNSGCVFGISRHQGPHLCLERLAHVLRLGVLRDGLLQRQPQRPDARLLALPQAGLRDIGPSDVLSARAAPAGRSAGAPPACGCFGPAAPASGLQPAASRRRRGHGKSDRHDSQTEVCTPHAAPLTAAEPLEEELHELEESSA